MGNAAEVKRKSTGDHLEINRRQSPENKGGIEAEVLHSKNMSTCISGCITGH
jgi:hypothetical protein